MNPALWHAGAFRQERRLYTDPGQPLGRFLPQMLRVAEGADSGLRDAQGAVMAPCIVMEKGEALDVWIQNSGEKIDMFTGLQARPPPPSHLPCATLVHRNEKEVSPSDRYVRWHIKEYLLRCRCCPTLPTG